MSKRNGNIHANTPKTSTADSIALGAALEEKFLELCESYQRIRKEDLVPPSWLDKDILRWREMRVRHKKGDFRNTESEVKSTRAIAQWTVDMNCGLRNQPTVKIDWGE